MKLINERVTNATILTLPRLDSYSMHRHINRWNFPKMTSILSVILGVRLLICDCSRDPGTAFLPKVYINVLAHLIIFTVIKSDSSVTPTCIYIRRIIP